MDGANTGPYSAVANFSVVDAGRCIETPTPLEPTGNLATNRPEFKVRNGRVTRPGRQRHLSIRDRDRAGSGRRSSPWSPRLPSPSGTTTMSLGDLPYDRTFYWRVWATDGTTQSGYSSVVVVQDADAATATATATATTASAGADTNADADADAGADADAAPRRRRRRPRTPDPAPGQRLPLPTYGASVVQQVAAARPDLLRNSCQEHGGTWGFMDAVVDTLRTYDTRWGYNWKRGNVGDPSHGRRSTITAAPGRDEGIDRGLHHRHHRRPLRRRVRRRDGTT